MDIEYVTLEKAERLLSEGKVRSIFHIGLSSNMDYINKQMERRGTTMKDHAFVRNDVK